MYNVRHFSGAIPATWLCCHSWFWLGFNASCPVNLPSPQLRPPASLGTCGRDTVPGLRASFCSLSHRAQHGDALSCVKVTAQVSPPHSSTHQPMHPTQNRFALLRIFFAKEITTLYVEQHFKPSHPAQAMPVHRSWIASLARTGSNETRGEHSRSNTLQASLLPAPGSRLLGEGREGAGDKGSA